MPTLTLSCPNCHATIRISPAAGRDYASFRCPDCGKYSTVNNLLAVTKLLNLDKEDHL